MPRVISEVRAHKCRVMVYSASRKGVSVFGHIGDKRWECEWYLLTTEARKRYDADPNYEHDHDADEVCRVSLHGTKAAAITKAQTVAGGSVYGCAIVQEHILEFFVEEDQVGDWEPVGPKFEVDSSGEVAEL